MAIGSQKSLLSPRQLDRKINKLIGIRIGLSTDSRNPKLTSGEQMALAVAADKLTSAINLLQERQQ